MCVRYYFKCWDHRNEWHNRLEKTEKTSTGVVQA